MTAEQARRGTWVRVMEHHRVATSDNSDEATQRLCRPLATVKGRIRLGLGKLRKNTALRELASG